MATSRHQTGRTKRGTGGATSRHSASEGATRWVRWGAVLGLFVVVAGLVTARVISAPSGTEGADPRPIARLEAPDFHSLLVDPADPDHVLFGAHSGTQESRDGGFTWEAGALRNADAMSLASSPEEPATIYAAGHDVFQVSRDGGQTWQPQEHDLPGTDIHGFAQDTGDPLRLYALVVGAGLFTSGDGGAGWTPLAAQPPGGGMPIGLATGEATLYAATETGLALSRDQGVTWAALPSQPKDGVLSLAIPASEPRTIYAGTTNGLFKSGDGGMSWRSLGPPDVPVLALAVAASDPNRVVMVDDAGGVFRSDDGAASWRAPQ